MQNALVLFIVLLFGTSCTSTAQSFSVLVFSKTAGYRHSSIPAGIKMIQELGVEHGFDVDLTEDSTAFTAENLANYDAVIFLSTTGNVLAEAQEAAFEDFIRAGKGYVGIHAAADTEYDWPFYRELVGRQFVQHPEHQQGTIHTIPSTFPGMSGFGDSLTLYEEWYEYTVPYAVNLEYLMRIDTASYQTGGWIGKDQMGVFHPLAWVHEHAGGRAFYTGIGHMDDTYALPAFRDHVLAGIRWAATEER